MSSTADNKIQYRWHARTYFRPMLYAHHMHHCGLRDDHEKALCKCIYIYIYTQLRCVYIMCIYIIHRIGLYIYIGLEMIYLAFSIAIIHTQRISAIKRATIIRNSW